MLVRIKPEGDYVVGIGDVLNKIIVSCPEREIEPLAELIESEACILNGIAIENYGWSNALDELLDLWETFHLDREIERLMGDGTDFKTEAKACGIFSGLGVGVMTYHNYLFFLRTLSSAQC